MASNSWLKLADILTQNIIIHPFISLRRTCQKQQGLAPLYKGLSSELTVKALMGFTEAGISNYTGWPRDFTKRNFFDNAFKYLSLKALTVTLITPFLCSSAIETVQSAIVVKDRPAFVECLKEGLSRLLHLRYIPSTRLLPIWILVGPTIAYHVSHVLVAAFARRFVSFVKCMLGPNCHRPVRDLSIYDDVSMNENSINGTRMLELNEVDTDCCEISTNLTANFIADIVLFPLETVMHSLYLQGSRAIVDNCDETTVVLPVITNYDGFTDCYQSIVKMEGTLGLYKGLGGVFLQFTLHYVIIRLTHHMIREFTNCNTRKK